MVGFSFKYNMDNLKFISFKKLSIFLIPISIMLGYYNSERNLIVIFINSLISYYAILQFIFIFLFIYIWLGLPIILIWADIEDRLKLKINNYDISMAISFILFYTIVFICYYLYYDKNPFNFLISYFTFFSIDSDVLIKLLKMRF